MVKADKATFGGELRKEREQKKFTVGKISQTTKVSERHILALEAGDFEELPGGVFRRGFVRSYIGALGLEQDEWMARFERVCHESGIDTKASADWTKFAENVSNSRSPHRRPAA